MTSTSSGPSPDSLVDLRRRRPASCRQPTRLMSLPLRTSTRVGGHRLADDLDGLVPQPVLVDEALAGDHGRGAAVATSGSTAAWSAGRRSSATSRMSSSVYSSRNWEYGLFTEWRWFFSPMRANVSARRRRSAPCTRGRRCRTSAPPAEPGPNPAALHHVAEVLVHRRRAVGELDCRGCPSPSSRTRRRARSRRGRPRRAGGARNSAETPVEQLLLTLTTGMPVRPSS